VRTGISARVGQLLNFVAGGSLIAIGIIVERDLFSL
jgi:hypothetical protein